MIENMRQAGGNRVKIRVINNYERNKIKVEIRR